MSGRRKVQYSSAYHGYPDRQALERARQLARENLERIRAQQDQLPQSDYIARPLTVPVLKKV
jgi:hypothetical protein